MTGLFDNRSQAFDLTLSRDGGVTETQPSTPLRAEQRRIPLSGTESTTQQTGGRVTEITDEQQEKQRIENVIDAEVEAMADDDIESYLPLLSEDALFLPPGLPSIRGAELHAWLREFLDEWRVEWLAYHHNETEIGTVFAFHRFSYSRRLEPKSGGQLQVSHGKGLHILRRSGDGSWRIARETWNDRPTPNTL